jgi:ribosomal protein S18 acetylase RimI-like enzyme
MIEHARSLSPSLLELHTHQRNERARRFYEQHSFSVVQLGVSPPPESEPDVFYRWQPEPVTSAPRR